MTKNEYLNSLETALKKKGIADAEEILSEYQLHFAYKVADGYSEQEISAKLGDPAALAEQFATDVQTRAGSGKKAAVVTGLIFIDLFAGGFYLLLGAWLVVMAGLAAVCAAAAVCLVGGFNIYALIPEMPYWCGAVFALALAALSVLAAVGCVYFAAFMKQLGRAYGRFHRNSIASASQKAVLPALALYPQLPAQKRRRLRAAALLSLSVFAVCLTAAFIVSAASAGAIQFWHEWGWFI